MHFSITLATFVALAASSLAAPVLDRRAAEVLVFTEYTTIITTRTVTDNGKPSTPTAGHYGYYTYGGRGSSSRFFQYHSSSSAAPAPAPTSVVKPVQPITSQAPTTVAPQPVTSTIVSTIIISTSAPQPVVTPTPAPPAPQPVTTSTPAAPAPTDDSFKSQVLTAHNNYRAIHSAPPLVWNDTTAAFAQTVSSPCIFKHSGGPYGENLAAGYPTAVAAIKAWYDEGVNYDYAAAQFTESTGHFTQVVWKNAKQIGCAMATCNGANGTPGAMLTCDYDTGNVIGQFAQNVLPPTS